jgi:hypothetical protein
MVFEVIRDIQAVLFAPRKRQNDDLDLGGLASEGFGDNPSIFLPRAVAMRDDDDLSVTEDLSKFRFPALGAATGGSREPNGPEPVGVLLALGQEGSLAEGKGFADFWEAVENALDALEIPGPTAFAIGPTLSEVLGL